MKARAGNSIWDFETLFSDFLELLNGSGLTLYMRMCKYRERKRHTRNEQNFRDFSEAKEFFWTQNFEFENFMHIEFENGVRRSSWKVVWVTKSSYDSETSIRWQIFFSCSWRAIDISGYFSRTWFKCSHMVVKPPLYCTRKCCCKCSVMSASSRLQAPCNGSTGQVPRTELLKTIAIHRNTHVHLLARLIPSQGMSWHFVDAQSTLTKEPYFDLAKEASGPVYLFTCLFRDPADRC